ncbi:LysR family transcriptional regulator [Oceanobacillus polygoni]|uniref:DNA-binding transcriptional LysR family regulator n=1 Tax=Oceanobacillus polygoni TaxID=1235259 RepID=A0A9X0YTN0_9BACI|nr:LysR family transcriptional regulator [Oceanobacillus polygoni]MBP2076949.1 DNA-binding transcriptional LysR family regulator [Oceanobacillus polygoni]
MNIENIEAFVLVNHFGSINKASKALFLSQPSVTARIQSLERELDTKLFDRVGRQLVITEQAKDFLPYAEQIIQYYKTGKKQLKAKELSDQLVIGCTELISNYLFPKVIPAFSKEYPNVQLKLVTGSSDTIQNKVLNREVDIGFVRNSSHPLITSEKVLESPINLFVQPDHPFASLDSINIEALAKEPIIFFECGSLDWSMIRNLFQNLSVKPSIQYEVDNMEAAKGLMVSGTGIGFLPEISVRNELARQELVRVNLPFVSNLSLKTNMIVYTEETPNYYTELLEIAKLEGSKRN